MEPEDVAALRQVVPWVVVETFYPEIAGEEIEGGSSEEEGWMEEDSTASESASGDEDVSADGNVEAE